MGPGAEDSLLEEVAMTALRRRMIEDMQLAGLSEGTQARYLTGVAHLAKAYGQSPERITEEEACRVVSRYSYGLSSPCQGRDDEAFAMHTLAAINVRSKS